MKPLFAVFTAALAALPLQHAYAQQTDGGTQWGLGGGLSIERRPYLGIDNKTRALPLLLVENRYLSILGPGVDIKLPPAGPLRLSVRARYSMDGYEADDAPILNGMAERKGAFWLGGAGEWRIGAARLSGEWLAATDSDKGQKVKLGAEYHFRTGDWTVTPRVAASWMDRKYVNYYYGVRSEEVRPGRAFYDGDASASMEFGIRVNYALAPKQSVFVDAGVTRLGSGIKDSPIVGRSQQTGLRLGYLYRF